MICWLRFQGANSEGRRWIGLIVASGNSSHEQCVARYDCNRVLAKVQAVQVTYRFVPIAANDESQDRPFARTDQEGKAALRIAILFALTWGASVQRKRVYRSSNCLPDTGHWVQEPKCQLRGRELNQRGTRTRPWIQPVDATH